LSLAPAAAGLLRCTAVTLLAACVATVPPAPAAWRTASCGGADYRYLLVPAARRGPALVLLHGAGDRPESMIAAWQAFAVRRGIVLVAPVLPRVTAFEAAAPRVLRCVVEDARGATPIDRRRVYLFGHSMGGYLAYDAATLASDYFAAAAVHAMGIAPEYDWVVDSARRRTPMAIYIGDRDPFVPLAGVRRTRDLLVAHGFRVHYVELRNHDHDYFAMSDWINADAWAFLRRQRLPAEPAAGRAGRGG